MEVPQIYEKDTWEEKALTSLEVQLRTLSQLERICVLTDKVTIDYLFGSYNAMHRLQKDDPRFIDEPLKFELYKRKQIAYYIKWRKKENENNF